MDLDRAVTQIDSIWQQLGHVQTFRGYRYTTVAATGVVGLFAALVQAIWLPEPVRQVDAYLILWVGVATACSVLVSIELLVRYRQSSRLERAVTRRAAEQFAPCLILGAALTWAVSEVAAEAVWMLPGLWSLLFALGIFASARLINPALNCVAAYYAVAGIGCLFFAREAYACSPWAMVIPFGLGQLAMSLVLYRFVEQSHGE